MIRRPPSRSATPKRRSFAARPLEPESSIPAVRAGKDLVLATKPFATDDPSRSWWYVLSTAGLLLAALAGTLWIPFLAGRIVASVASGLLILRLFVIYHDQQHHAILPNSTLAEVLATMFGIWALSPSSIWRASHNHHHNHNSKLRGSQIGSFPIMTADAFHRLPRGARFKYLAMRHPLTLVGGYGAMFLYGMCLNPFMARPRKHWDCLAALVLHLALGTGLVLWKGWTALLLTQTLPSLIACAIGSYLFYVQHNFPGVVFRDKAGWTYETAALESSSFLSLNPLMAWFTANIGYHHIHHLNHRIPFYRLPEVMRAIPELQNPKTIGLGLADIRRCLRLKVWDTARQRMTPVAGS